MVKLGVLQKSTGSPWGLPSFFRPKKNGGVRLVSDMRKLNQCLQRESYPLPVIDDIIWKINGFKFATCLDFNRGYYHFKLDKPSQKICTIVLPWGNIHTPICHKVSCHPVIYSNLLCLISSKIFRISYFTSTIFFYLQRKISIIMSKDCIKC